MLSSLRRAALSAALIFCAAVTAFAWTEADYDRHDYQSFEKLPEAKRRIDMRNIDYPLLNAAVFYETNRQRVRQGMKPFRHSSVLERSAQGHSEDMVRRDFLAHESPVPGKRTPAERMVKAGLDFTSGAVGENIDDIFGLEYESGAKVYPPQGRQKYFSYEPHGRPIEAHTYLGLAREALDGWMESPPHRANILDPRFSELGTGAAHYRDASFGNIDRFKLTQNFYGNPAAER